MASVQCPDCRTKVRVGVKYCPVCGRAFKWEGTGGGCGSTIGLLLLVCVGLYLFAWYQNSNHETPGTPAISQTTSESNQSNDDKGKDLIAKMNYLQSCVDFENAIARTHTVFGDVYERVQRQTLFDSDDWKAPLGDACLELHRACAVFKNVKVPALFSEEGAAEGEYADCADNLASAYEQFLRAVDSGNNADILAANGAVAVCLKREQDLAPRLAALRIKTKQAVDVDTGVSNSQATTSAQSTPEPEPEKPISTGIDANLVKGAHVKINFSTNLNFYDNYYCTIGDDDTETVWDVLEYNNSTHKVYVLYHDVRTGAPRALNCPDTAVHVVP